MKAIIALMLILNSLSGYAQQLSDAIPYPFYEKNDRSENQMMLVENSLAAMQLRLEMIRRAKKSIEVEYFIYNTDVAGKIISRELIAAALRGVKVRILVDKSAAVFALSNAIAKEFSQNGVELRYYNNSPIYLISSVQFRNHRKLITVDDNEALSGGRNIGDDYFDLSTQFNFYDSDIYIKGPLAKTMRASFDEYFDHKITERPPLSKGSSSKAQAFLAETEEEIAARKLFATTGKNYLDKIKLHTCPEATFTTDAPGAKFTKRISPHYSDKFRFVRKTLHDKISVIDKSILISSPYMINNKVTRRLMKGLLKNKVEITLYTNSLASTDAVYVAANLYLDLMRWRKQGINIYLHDGKWLGDVPELSPEVQQARWGTHTKAQVYETSTYSEIMVGTYNIDNRSHFYNSEMAVFCKGNDEFTQEVKSSIMDKRAHLGYHVNIDGTATDKEGNTRNIYGSDRSNLFLMKMITLPSWLLRFLL